MDNFKEQIKMKCIFWKLSGNHSNHASSFRFSKKEEKEWKKVLDISWRTRYNNYRSLEKIEGAFAGD